MTENKQEIFMAALIAAQKDINPLKKEATNPFFKSKYVKLGEILAEIKPALNNNSLFVTFILEKRETPDGFDHIIAKIIHKNGEFIQCPMPIKIAKEADKNDPQKYAAATTYAKRYSIVALMALEEEDDDGNQAAGKGEIIPILPLVPQKEYADIKELMENSTCLAELEAASHELKKLQIKFYFSKEQLTILRQCYSIIKKAIEESGDNN